MKADFIYNLHFIQILFTSFTFHSDFIYKFYISFSWGNILIRGKDFMRFFHVECKIDSTT